MSITLKQIFLFIAVSEVNCIYVHFVVFMCELITRFRLWAEVDWKLYKYTQVMFNSVLWSETAGFGLHVLILQECSLSNLDKAS